MSRKLSEETRKKISENHADVSGVNNPMYGRKRPQYVKDAVANANRERVWKESSRKKISSVFKGKKQTAEQISKRIKRGEDHYMWQGDKVNYKSLHLWIGRNLHTENKCSKCGLVSSNSRRFHWANVDHKYKRVATDWIRMCVSCHIKFDKLNGLR